MTAPEPMDLVFGLVETSAGGDGSAAFGELAAWLREHDGVSIERKCCTSYRALAESVRAGESDIAWLPPVAYAWLAEAVTPLGCILRGNATTYSAALVALEDSKLHLLTDVVGARAGWVDPWSAAGYVVPRIELARAGRDLSAMFKTEKFYGSHREALLALSRGECDVVGTYARGAEGEEQAKDGAWSELEGVRVRVLATFTSIPSDVIAVRRNLAPKGYERALGALRHACTDAAARPLVRAVFGGDELHEGIDPGHAALRQAFESATAKGLFD